jgi:hypothetical protein
VFFYAPTGTASGKLAVNQNGRNAADTMLCGKARNPPLFCMSCTTLHAWSLQAFLPVMPAIDPLGK